MSSSLRTRLLVKGPKDIDGKSNMTPSGASLPFLLYTPYPKPLNVSSFCYPCSPTHTKMQFLLSIYFPVYGFRNTRFLHGVYRYSRGYRLNQQCSSSHRQLPSSQPILPLFRVCGSKSFYLLCMRGTPRYLPRSAVRGI